MKEIDLIIRNWKYYVI